LNYRKKVKAELSRLILRKLTANLELLIVINLIWIKSAFSRI